MSDEEQLDNIIAQSQQQGQTDTVTTPDDPTEEQIIEQKARESGRPTKATVLQKRTELSEDELESRIAGILAENIGKIDEEQLRGQIADKLETKGRITEADLVQIKDSLLRKSEQSTQLDLSSKLASADSQFQRVVDRVASLQTPGGLGVLIAILIFFLWVIIPVTGGRTRLQLLWGILTSQVGFRQDILQKEEKAIADRDKVSGDGTTLNSSNNSMTFIPLALGFGDGEWHG